MKADLLAKAFVGAATFLTLWAGICAGLTREEEAPQLRVAIEQSGRSLVLVRGFSANLPFPPSLPCSANTGFFMDTGGHVLTSIYAIVGCSRIEVVTGEGITAEGALVGLDQGSGLALLRTPLRNTVPLMAAVEAPERGELVLAAVVRPQSAASFRVAYRTGMLSSTEGSLKLWGVQREGLLLSALPIGPGGASAPLLNAQGQLAGVVLAVVPDEKQEPICYGIAWERVAEMIAELEVGGRRLGWLGVALEEPRGVEGVAVSAVLEKSPAFAAGIRPNDVLLSIDDQTITDPSVLEQKVACAAPGTVVHVKLLHDNETRTLPVRIGARPVLISRVPPGRMTVSRFPASRQQAPGVPSPWEVEAERCLRMLWEMRKENEALRARVNELEERVRALEQEQGNR